MPIARFQMPDGRVARFEVPEGTTPEQAQAMIQAELPKVSPGDTAPVNAETGKSFTTSAQETIRDISAGAIRGAGSIGATILTPLDWAAQKMGIQNDFIGRDDRRSQMDAGLGSLGADTDSIAYAGGKLGAEIAGTAGAGGVVAKGLSAIPMLSKLAPVIQSGGFNLGTAKTGSTIANAGLRAVGGGVQGGAAAGLVDPEYAKTGAGIGMVAPGAIAAAGKAGDLTSRGLDAVSRKLMNSALKPTIEMHRKGEAARAVQTMLDEGLNATKGGVEKLNVLVDDINAAIKRAIGGSQATVDKGRVLDKLDDTRAAFMKDVSPASALNQIDDVAHGFRNHPVAQGNNIPVQLAQDLKTGTYRTLKKSYGEMKGAETEARKALARGLKDEIAAAVPEVAGLNAKEAALLNALKVAERRALMDANKNPVGLGPLAPNTGMLLAFLADRSAALKSLAARGAYQTSKAHVPTILPQLTQQYGLLGAPSVLATSP